MNNNLNKCKKLHYMAKKKKKKGFSENAYGVNSLQETAFTLFTRMQRQPGFAGKLDQPLPLVG